MYISFTNNSSEPEVRHRWYDIGTRVIFVKIADSQPLAVQCSYK